MAIRIIQPAERPFTMVDRDALRDRRLSISARGLYAVLRGLPGDWVFRQEHLACLCSVGKDKFSAMVAELKKIGALAITPHQLSEEEAREKNAENPPGKPGKKYFKGHVFGQDWVLNPPGDWVSEEDSRLLPSRPPENPGDGIPVPRVSRVPGFPASEKPAPKNNEFTKNNLKKEQQQTREDPVVVFFEAVGQDEGLLADARELIGRDLAGASQEQARWAGMAWTLGVAHGNVTNPVGLARKLARMAAAGQVCAPASVAREKKDEARAAAAAAGEVAHQAALQAAAAAVMREIQASQVPGGRGNVMDIIKPRFPAP